MKAAATPTLALAALLLLSGTPAAGQTNLILTGGVNVASMEFHGSLNDFLGVLVPHPLCQHTRDTRGERD